jgi:hypothetical protein
MSGRERGWSGDLRRSPKAPLNGGGWHGRSPQFSMPACLTFGGANRSHAQNGPMPPSRFWIGD